MANDWTVPGLACDRKAAKWAPAVEKTYVQMDAIVGDATWTFEDGILTDSLGNQVDFRNTLIIMTSNLGSEFLVNQPEGEDTSAVREQVMGMVRAHFRPEFLNRVDEIILFHRLQKSEMGRIVEIQFSRLQKLLEDRKITLDIDKSAIAWLACAGYDPVYGARPLKRAIQRDVQDPLALAILLGVAIGPSSLFTAASIVLRRAPRSMSGTSATSPCAPCGLTRSS